MCDAEALLRRSKRPLAATIRGGTRSFELSSIAAATFYLDVEVTVRVAGRLAQAVADAPSLD